jgi:mRNA-degrading endonuclease RelE of RelBE toxin-antitoxin system
VAGAAGYYIVYMNVKLENRARKQFNRFDEATKSQLSAAMLDLEKDPPEGNIKRLHKSRADYRLRSGDYRIFFDILEDRISVTEISTRGQAYKKRR